jgi:two-component system, sporulation sensor kinase E
VRTFIERALRKLPKMTAEQITALLLSVAAENERLESVIDSLTEGLLVCDANHDLILVNKAAERLLPLSLYDQAERPLWSVVADDAVADFLKKALLGGDKVMDRELDVEAKGAQRLLSLTVLPLVKDKRVTGSLIHVEDITEKRGKEARLRRAENLASLTTLAAGVAHEIKNPLGSISIHIQLIQKALKASRAACEDVDGNAGSSGGERSAPQAPFGLIDKYLGIVNEEIDRLNRIVVDFLFAVRPMDIELREGDLNALIRELVEFMRYELEAARIACDLRLARDLPDIRYDERYIKQALLNLVKNAVAAMPSGGTLTIRTESAADEVKLTIADTGIGIPEENLPKIFEPYFTTKESGSGLGLTLVFKIIKEHRGEITVKSKEGEGTAFTIVLPVPQKETRLIAFGGESE